MSLLKEVQAWSEAELPLWLQDAARRVFHNQTLTPKDYDELYLLLKSSQGIEIPEDLVASPLSKEDIPAETNDDNPVILKSLKNLTNVNKIASNQSLDFCDNGVTIIYGGNGAGKSGYARVLKHACRARVKGGDILPDAGKPHPPEKPKAEFIISKNSILSSLNWVNGSTPPDQLSTLSVFDSNCASAYLVEGDAAYLPRGLDIVENLANSVIPELTARLTTEIINLDTSTDIIAIIPSETSAGKLLKNIDQNLNIKELKALSVVSEADKKRITDITNVIAEGDPLTKALELKKSVSHLKILAKNLLEKSKYTNLEAINELNKLKNESIAADLSVKQAAEALSGEEELLPGTGEPIWKALFIAAQKFSETQAYKDYPFPNVEHHAKCVLCQQSIAGATDRMRRFKEHINHDISKLASEKSLALSKAITTLENSNLDFGLNPAIKVEVSEYDTNLLFEIEDYSRSTVETKTWLLKKFKDNIITDQPATPPPPFQKIRNLAAIKLSLARTYTKASDAKKLENLKNELQELNSRAQLEKLLTSIEKLVLRMALKTKLELCKKQLNPKPLSTKSKYLANKVITKALKDALDSEFELLGVGHIKTKLKDRIDKAKVKFTLLLDLPTSNKIDTILSEGEQRAVSLASFLAELKLTNHRSGIIFDDPVSSLDHTRRRKVAHRLVTESKLRQVIILTHDIAFLSELIDAINILKVEHLIHHLEWIGDSSGNIKTGLPWDKAGYKERVSTLKLEARRLLPWSPYPNEIQVADARNVYSRIRATIEAMVETVILNGVVTRFGEVVGVGNLSKISGLKTEHCVLVTDLWKKCHRITGSHDQPVLKDSPVPSPEEMLIDIQSILDYAALVTDSRKQISA